MKTTRIKKSLCLLLVLAALLSCFPVSASAASVDIFDANWYASHNSDVVNALGRSESALRGHYENYGKREGRAPSSLFDPKFYLNSYPDLKAAFGTNYVAAYNHFLSNGIQEGRQGSASFNVSVYKQNYADLRNAFGTSNSDNWKYLNHWLQYGQKEQRNAVTLISSSSSSSSSMTDVTRSFAGKTVVLRSVQNGKYLCADGNLSNTPAVCNRTSASTWETFTVSVTSDGWAGFKAYNGKYLSARKDLTNCPLTATASSLQSWECFRIYQKGNDYYIKAQINNKYLCVRVDTSNAPTQAYASAASTWERFQIQIVGGNTATNSSTTTMYVKTNGINLNVRSSASTSASILGQLANGSKVNVYNISNGWAKIQYNGKTAYVSSQYLSQTNPTENSTTSTSYWQWPVENYMISQEFGRYSSSMAKKGRPYHSGIDLVNSVSRNGGNPPIKAAASGTVKYRGYTNGNGNHVIIQHNFNGQTVYSLYSHLLNFEKCPNVGQPVSKGQQIGLMGNTGNSTGTHLHFAIYTGYSNDPLGYTTVNNAMKMSTGSITFYNPASVIANNKLPN